MESLTSISLTLSKNLFTDGAIIERFFVEINLQENFPQLIDAWHT